VIAFVGSVFSPYYAWAGRRDPLDHCALNVALYGDPGARWCMTERGRGAVERRPNVFRIGPSGLGWSEGALSVDIDEVAAPLPRRARGRITLTADGVGAASPLALDPHGHHFWWPIAPSARITVEMARPRLSWNGHAYLDSNFGSRPLESDFAHWHWSRSALRSGTATLYGGQYRDGNRFDRALFFDRRDGPVEFSPPPAAPLSGLSLWGVPNRTRTDRGAPPHLLRRLEDAPFYTRALLSTQLLGERAVTVHESLSLERFSRSWVRLLLPFRMPRRGGF